MPDTPIIDAYDAIAPHYREYSGKRQAYLDAVDRLVIDNLEPGSRLLDVGAGDGRRLAGIMQAARLGEVVAIEPSAEMAALCEAGSGAQVYRELGENLDRLEIGEFDAAIALWNIFGHIPGAQKRMRTLENIRDKLKPGGKLMLDVNNRHNAAAYGAGRVAMRVLIDSIDFRESRGDVEYEWRIGERSFPASGHLFIPSEIEGLLRDAGFEVSTRLSVDYASGAISRKPRRGQLFYLARPAGGTAR